MLWFMRLIEVPWLHSKLSNSPDRVSALQESALRTGH